MANFDRKERHRMWNVTVFLSTVPHVGEGVPHFQPDVLLKSPTFIPNCVERKQHPRGLARVNQRLLAPACLFLFFFYVNDKSTVSATSVSQSAGRRNMTGTEEN